MKDLIESFIHFAYQFERRRIALELMKTDQTFKPSDAVRIADQLMKLTPQDHESLDV